jgi:hypothetical protein
MDHDFTRPWSMDELKRAAVKHHLEYAHQQLAAAIDSDNSACIEVWEAEVAKRTAQLMEC